ncbi:hypothetical protein [Streptomyces sp. JB150]|uniref:hypothetical protein n=1 Tax=Streptomyces sp. JB150 TaxID=2714844 RepID=UPI00140DC320|nr:hypothetical protein [Streptomyces sp. JB150]QIJ61447.1 hypothetical protein G7Z13_04895 [Streptomyces sp. JB150]
MTADWEPEVEDIKAMRAEGGGADLRAFMRQQIATGKARRTTPPKPAAPKPPGHRPGAWPAGTHPPGPPPDWRIPAHLWRAAARHLSNEINRPDQPCDCGNCPPDTEETR